MALLSIAFFDRKLRSVEWAGIVFIISGLSVVGMSDFASGSSGEHKDTNSIITGQKTITSFFLKSFIKMLNLFLLSFWNF